ncbi:unnamed protein product [Brachionus calyciflorus]|uniref:SWIM-type domain-containing protein n=1 Tax=Brachionus calyciflorus TaxID=104777 RepID=A0A813UP99_9BILA|nr:unnamed protein product [Brachionus calyciflorus]
MKKKIEWIYMITVGSEVELEFYFKQFPKTVSNHTNSNNCTICKDNSELHKMKVRYPYCTCHETCLTRYLIMSCTKTNQTIVKGLNIHEQSASLVDPEHEPKHEIDLLKIIEYICIDADRAMANSILDVLPDSKIVMCWYHLKNNINKNAKKIPQAHVEKVTNDIIHLRSTKTSDSYDLKKKAILSKWKKLKGLDNFCKYFTKQWIDSPFCNWQLYQTPPGYAMSNSPIESYNSLIKAHFTNRSKFNLLPVFELFEKVVTLESRKVMANKFDIPNCAKITISLKRLAKLDLVKKIETGENSDKYLVDGKYTVLINKECFCPECTNCTCAWFLDVAKCAHLVSCCLFSSINFPGIKYKSIVNKSKSKKRKAGEWHELE